MKSLNPAIAQYAAVTVETCAYAGTGNVLKVQEMLHACTDRIEDAEKSSHQVRWRKTSVTSLCISLDLFFLEGS